LIFKSTRKNTQNPLETNIAFRVLSPTRALHAPDTRPGPSFAILYFRQARARAETQ
jgi:hypothetical protein